MNDATTFHIITAIQNKDGASLSDILYDLHGRAAAEHLLVILMASDDPVSCAKEIRQLLNPHFDESTCALRREIKKRLNQ